MFFRLYKAKLKVLLKNKAMLFWTLIFPFVLGTFFQIALGGSNDIFKFKIVPIAVVENESYKENEALGSVISSLSEPGENQIFDTRYVAESEAEELLKDNAVAGYISIVDKKPELFINQNGINQTIIKTVLDQYYQMTTVAESIIEYSPEAIQTGVLVKLQENPEIVKDTSSEKIDFSIHYFFTLIAMACFYGSLLGIEIIKDSEANLSSKGARVCIAPVSKIKIVAAGLLAGYTIQLVALAGLFAFLILAFDVNFGPHLFETALLSAVGCLGGLSLGTFVGVSNKKPEGFKIALLIGVVMVLCFFAGMMGSPMSRASMDESLPFLAAINPVHMLTDGLYALFAYDTFEVFYTFLGRLAIFALIMVVLTFIFVRRRNYDSI